MPFCKAGCQICFIADNNTCTSDVIHIPQLTEYLTLWRNNTRLSKTFCNEHYPPQPSISGFTDLHIPKNRPLLAVSRNVHPFVAGVCIACRKHASQNPKPSALDPPRPCAKSTFQPSYQSCLHCIFICRRTGLSMRHQSMHTPMERVSSLHAGNMPPLAM